MDVFGSKLLMRAGLKCLPLSVWIYLYPGLGGGSTHKPIRQRANLGLPIHQPQIHPAINLCRMYVH
jgi:hypothetical protein